MCHLVDIPEHWSVSKREIEAIVKPFTGIQLFYANLEVKYTDSHFKIYLHCQFLESFRKKSNSRADH